MPPSTITTSCQAVWYNQERILRFPGHLKTSLRWSSGLSSKWEWTAKLIKVGYMHPQDRGMATSGHGHTVSSRSVLSLYQPLPFCHVHPLVHNSPISANIVERTVLPHIRFKRCVLRDFVIKVLRDRWDQCSLVVKISVSGEGVYSNRVNVSAICDQTRLHTTLKFRHVFRGSIFVTDFYFDDGCRFMYRSSNETEFNISFPISPCGFDVIESGRKTFSRTSIKVQHHHMIQSIFDKSFAISCEIPPLLNETSTAIVARLRERDKFTIPDDPIIRVRFELKSGLRLFGRVGEPVESNLYFIVSLRDRGEHRDMIVQNCYAHSSDILNNRTALFHVSNFYGCPDPSYILANFSISNETNDGSNLLAYALVKNFTLLSKRRIHFTCAITLCESSCPSVCNGSEPLSELMWTDVITKKIVRRRDNTNQTETPLLSEEQRRRKRSLGDIMSRFFTLEFLNNVSEAQMGTNATLETNDGNVETSAVIANATNRNDIEVLTLEAFQNTKTSFVSSMEVEYFNVTKGKLVSSTTVQVASLFLCVAVTGIVVFCCQWEDLLINLRRKMCSFYRSLR
ncbi:ZP domain-containing protein [Trichonephila clavipes]|nr:ZP domain-containing protein [Trichonephila clavipes]